MNILTSRLPQPRRSVDSAASFFLQMTEDELRAWLRQHGYSEHYVEQELMQLREARERHGLAGPAHRETEETAGGGPVDRAAERRRERRDAKEKHE